MKYKRMLCLVNKRTKAELSKLNQQYNIPILFVNSFEEFENNIQEETFILLLRHKADRNIRKLIQLINSFPNYTFFAYVQSDDPCTTSREFNFSREKNVVNCDKTDVFNLYYKNVSINQPAELVQLFKDFSLLISKVQLSLIEECARNFLVDCEGYSLRKAEKAFPLTQLNLINETIKYKEELQWYIDHRQQNTIENNENYFKKISFYKKSSLSGLSTLKSDRDSEHFNERKEQYTDLLNRLISLFNRLLAIARNEIQEIEKAQLSNWIELYELSDISIDNLEETEVSVTTP